jgi:hypothetical protein
VRDGSVFFALQIIIRKFLFMAITWIDQYAADQATLVNKLSAGFSFADNGKRVALPVQYAAAPNALARTILDLVEPHTAYAITTLSAVLSISNATRPVDPGSEPAPETLRFRLRTAANGPEHKDALWIPGFMATTADDVQQLGESIAAAMEADAGILSARFVGTPSGYRR